MAMNRVEVYSQAAATPSAGLSAGSGTGAGGGAYHMSSGSVHAEVSAVSAGVSLYKSAQELEQISRNDEDRKKNAPQIAAIKAKLADRQFIAGFGSIGGEEFFSYLNISDSLHRAGGAEWQKWNADMTAKVLKLQNEDGTWAGHHCITGRVAVTSAAVLLLLADREPVTMLTKAKAN